MTLANTRPAYGGAAIGLHRISGALKHTILDRGRTLPRVVWVQRDRSAQDATS